MGYCEEFSLFLERAKTDVNAWLAEARRKHPEIAAAESEFVLARAAADAAANELVHAQRSAYEFGGLVEMTRKVSTSGEIGVQVGKVIDEVAQRVEVARKNAMSTQGRLNEALLQVQKTQDPLVALLECKRLVEYLSQPAGKDNPHGGLNALSSDLLVEVAHIMENDFPHVFELEERVSRAETNWRSADAKLRAWREATKCVSRGKHFHKSQLIEEVCLAFGAQVSTAEAAESQTHAELEEAKLNFERALVPLRKYYDLLDEVERIRRVFQGSWR